MKWKRILKWSPLVILVFLFTWFQIVYWTSTNDCGHSISPGAERMKAIKYCEYGPPDVLKIEEVEKPVPKEDELMVRVRAASLDFIDAGLVRGPAVIKIDADGGSAGAVTAGQQVLATGFWAGETV